MTARLSVLALLFLTACATTPPKTIPVQRATEGPTADEVWRARFATGYGRLPTFDGTTAWKEQVQDRVRAYLGRHPEIATSPRATQFRFHRRVAVGMTKEEVVLLLERPDSTTSDEAAMRAAAAQFWPAIQPHACEMWMYPPGWQLYFESDRLADLTVSGREPL